MARLVRGDQEFSLEIHREGDSYAVYVSQWPRGGKLNEPFPSLRDAPYEIAKHRFDDILRVQHETGWLDMTRPGIPYSEELRPSVRPSLNKLEIHASRLIREELGITHMIPYSQLKNIRVEADIDYHVNSLLLKLRTYLLRDAKTHYYTQDLEVPASWWQQFKQECFPLSLIELFPVKMKKVSFQYEKYIHLCPHGDVDFGNDVHVKFLTHPGPSKTEQFLDSL